MKEDDNELTVQQLSEDELVSIIGAVALGVGKCPQCGATTVVATKSLPPICFCTTCGHVWTAGEDGGTPTTCGVNCQPGCKSRCLSGGKK